VTATAVVPGALDAVSAARSVAVPGAPVAVNAVRSAVVSVARSVARSAVVSAVVSAAVPGAPVAVNAVMGAVVPRAPDAKSVVEAVVLSQCGSRASQVLSAVSSLERGALSGRNL